MIADRATWWLEDLHASKAAQHVLLSMLQAHDAKEPSRADAFGTRWAMWAEKRDRLDALWEENRGREVRHEWLFWHARRLPIYEP